jgi:hypothetical protein
MAIKNVISNANMNSAILLFGLVISLAFMQLYQSSSINSENNAPHNKNSKEAFSTQDISDTNANIIDEINSLKDVEEDLYAIIESFNIIIQSSESTDEEKAEARESIQDYIVKIENVNKLRVNLYRNLITNYEILQQNVIDASTNAAVINEAADIAKNSVAGIAALKEDQTNNQRYVEVNTYYAKRYEYLTGIVKIIIYICIGMIILSVLANNGIIPEWLYSWLLIILLVFGLYFLGKKLFLLFNVDNMDFDRSDWHFTAPSPSATTTTPTTPPVGST